MKYCAKNRFLFGQKCILIKYRNMVLLYYKVGVFMGYCTNCGKEINDKENYCSNCGGNITTKTDTDKSTRLKCPHCGSNNIQVQIVSQNQRTGCFKILLYILLAITIVGIPIMILILLLRGKKTVNRKYYVCQSCGNTFNPAPSNNRNGGKGGKIAGIIIASVIGTFVLIGIIGAILSDSDYIDFDQYQPLNPQQLHNDYLDNEIAAKDNYTGKYYYISGEIHEITEYITDDYLILRYNSERDNSKIIEINAYFNSSDDLKDVKKGDYVTVYCKFKQRSIENYMNTITSYSFHSCRFKTEE